MKNIFVFTALLTGLGFGQKRFNSQYFINKHNLSLPLVEWKQLESQFTHVSHTREYHYQDSSMHLDSMVDWSTFEGSRATKKIHRCLTKSDSSYCVRTTYELEEGTIINQSNLIWTEGRLSKWVVRGDSQCIYHSKFDERGLKLLGVTKCPKDSVFTGQRFFVTKKKNYLESVDTGKGVVDSNHIRRYYLTPFDSIVADYMVRKNEKPFIVRLNQFDKNQRRTYSYGFGISREKRFQVRYVVHYRYDRQGKLHKEYLFRPKDFAAKIPDFELVNVTEQEYDQMGRLVKFVTRNKPEGKPED